MFLVILLSHSRGSGPRERTILCTMLLCYWSLLEIKSFPFQFQLRIFFQPPRVSGRTVVYL